MSTATSSVTTADPSWSTPTNQIATQQWQTQEQYQQYYDYYQSLSQTAGASTATSVATVAPTDPTMTSTYTQDYSKAWDEYYRAYYGQSYAMVATAAQYPTAGYNYDQYGYPNLAGPPPVYQYDTATTASTYQYAQPPAAAASVAPTSTSYPYTEGTYSAPPTLTWSAPLPAYQLPQSYQNTQTSYPTTTFNQSTSKALFSNDNGISSFDFSSKRGISRGRSDRDDSFRRPPRNNRFGQNKSGGRRDDFSGDNSFGNQGGRVSSSRSRGGGDSYLRGRSGYIENKRQSWGSSEENFDGGSKGVWETETGGSSLQKLSPSASLKRAPVPLMNIEVCPTNQSPVVVRRQGLIDQWQSAVRDIVDRNVNVQQYWPTLKTALVPEVQGLLSPLFIKDGDTIHVELLLDDIFLVQCKGQNEDVAIEEAAKAMWLLLQTRLYVQTAMRSYGLDKVPVFSVSQSATGPVMVPPFILIGPTTYIGETVPALVDDHLPKDQEFAAAMSELTADISEPSEAILESKEVVMDIIVAPHDYKEDDIFLVVDPALHDKDQCISVLNSTARFNKITIEYKHEKPPHAPHISQCLITINGQEFEKSEARDYLCAKRDAADKAVIIFKESCPQIKISYERAKEVVKDDLVKDKTVEEAINDMLKTFVASEEDSIYRFAQSFTSEDRDIVTRLTSNLNLASRQDGKNVILVYKQFSLEEIKRRLLRAGFCAQYQLVQSTLASKSA